MKERPILFSGPMVRAILDGSKTQTRRIFKPQPNIQGSFIEDAGHLVYCESPDIERIAGPSPVWKKVACPYGVPGDLIWVRETWQPFRLRTEAEEAASREINRKFVNGEYKTPDEIIQASLSRPGATGEVVALYAADYGDWASRIDLEITNIRVERLQEISAEDCVAEGLKPDMETHSGEYWREDVGHQFECLWESINGPGSWTANPWVWVVEFKRIRP